MKGSFICVLLMCGVATLSNSYAWHRDDYSYAIQQAKSIFEDNPKTLYCDCSYDNKLKVNSYSCRAELSAKTGRVSFEHLMKVDEFGQYFSCWDKPRCVNKRGLVVSGYKCCQLVSKTFRKLDGELYNLWPSITYLSKLRSHRELSSKEEGEKTLGCEFWLDNNFATVTTNAKARGIIARATLFMSDFYHIPLSPGKRDQLFAWHTLNPPSVWEKEWARKVAEIEGYQNPYITR